MMMSDWVSITPDWENAVQPMVYRQDAMEQHHIADGCDRDGKPDLALFSGAQAVILSPDELCNILPIRALIDALTGHEDRSLWWLGYVRTMVCEYERTHQWATDEDPSATADAIDKIKTGLVAVEEALEPFGVDISPHFYPAEFPPYLDAQGNEHAEY